MLDAVGDKAGTNIDVFSEHVGGLRIGYVGQSTGRVTTSSSMQRPYAAWVCAHINVVAVGPKLNEPCNNVDLLLSRCCPPDKATQTDVSCDTPPCILQSNSYRRSCSTKITLVQPAVG